ncbi:Mannose-6-phosphate isomerase [hydrothermal vent metagenome]|uniref:Mannose-6-phosphate isomerase n=1 Tax=hydrothermal vent metagenome TaxID=652676 RepID=A0A3B1AJ77_9ZZZZ
MHTRYDDIEAYETKDGSLIRELIHPSLHHNQQQSLAEAIVQPGQTTALHKHHKTEEIYFIREGHGRMTLGHEKFSVKSGDSIVIVAGTTHCIENDGDQDLHILCSCAPAYSHDDTELL